MCGITGIIKRSAAVDPIVLNQMIRAIKHRGPDDQSIWVEETVGLAHARLSIHDLSTGAHQPMFSASGRFVIVFNGEIYNFIELREALASIFSITMKTQSDTEVLVNAIECWGIDEALKKCVGMFAFAVWDRKEKKLFLARDRLGEKPLYYGIVDNDFVFSSELKSICAEYKPALHIDRNILSTYMAYSYVPTPYTIYSELKKLEPGQYLEINADLQHQHHVYWSMIEVASRPKVTLSFQEARIELEAKLRRTLSLQMLSDVPLGAFLSGGVDSSTIVALMQSMSHQPIKTFSIGFHDKSYNEAHHAKSVANHLRTHHTELYLSDTEAMQLVSNLSQIYDEPFADSSQIPTLLVSQLAKQSVTVSLSGDGGDEVFGGYNRYFLVNRVKSFIQNPWFNKFLNGCPSRYLKWLNYIPMMPVQHLGDKLEKLQRMAKISNGSSLDLYKEFCTVNLSSLIVGGVESKIVDKPEYAEFFSRFGATEAMMLIDTLNYLTDDILVKVDRAAMVVSLETRVPFLDHELIEFAWSLPESYKVFQGKGKRIVRELLYQYVPKKLIDRPKMGFGIPLGHWLTTGLRQWVEERLDDQSIRQQGFLDSAQVQRYWKEHKAGKHNHQTLLWNILMFQQWLQDR